MNTTTTNTVRLSPQEREIIAFAERNGSVSSREAFIDLNIPTSSLTKNISNISASGRYKVEKIRRRNPQTNRLYTRYFITERA